MCVWVCVSLGAVCCSHFFGQFGVVSEEDHHENANISHQEQAVSGNTHTHVLLMQVTLIGLDVFDVLSGLTKMWFLIGDTVFCVVRQL